MNVIGGPELLILATILITGVLPVWLGARVANKSGFSRAWGLLLLFIPLHPILSGS